MALTNDWGVDTAAPGMNSRLEARERQLELEIHSWLGTPFGQLLWDLKTFYDSIQIPVLIATAEDLGFPRDLLVVVCLLHLSPRALTHRDQAAEPILLVARSILAGCVSSTRLARAVLYPSLSAAAQDVDGAALGVKAGVHVDDVTQLKGHKG